MAISVPPAAIPTTGSAARGYRPAPLRATRRHGVRDPLNFASAPMLLAAAGFSLGILDARWVWHPPPTSLLAALLGVVLIFTASRYAERVLFLPLLLVWIAVGQFASYLIPIHTASAQLLQLADRVPRDVFGTVTAVYPQKTQLHNRPFSTEQYSEETEQVDLALHSVDGSAAQQSSQVPIHGGLRLGIYARPGEKLPTFSCGEHVRVTTRMRTPDRYLDPGAWDYPAYLRQHGIDVLGSAAAGSVQIVPAAHAFSLSCLATATQLAAGTRLEHISTLSTAVKTSHAWIPESLVFLQSDSDILRAMLFGDRSHLRHTLRTGFERTGSFHLLVVSGLHVTIVIALFFWLARKSGLGQFGATAVALCGALPYAFLTGFGPPVQRALWLSGVYLVSRIVFRERAAMNAIAIAALGILARTPSDLFDTSFQMTFLAVLAIAGVAAPFIEATVGPYLRGLRTISLLALDPHLPPRVTQMRVAIRLCSEHLQPLLGRQGARRIPVFLLRWMLRVAEALIVSTVVELAMMLPMAIDFHRITFFALPANLLGLPLLAFLLPLALLTFFLGCVQPGFALPFASLTALLLHAVTSLVHLFSRLSPANVRVATPPIWAIISFLLAWALALWLSRSAPRWKFAALAIIAVSSIVIVLPQRPELHPGVLEITALDVGQGDSLLVVTPDGHTLLVDAGGPIGGETQADSNFDIGEDIVSQYLWSRHIRRLDVVALTHAHSDHMGGMPVVLANFRPHALWVGNNPAIPAYLQLLRDAEADGVKVESWHAGEQFSFGSTVVRVLSPAAGYLPGSAASNDDSLVLRIAYGQTAALLEGDAQARSEQRMLANGIPATALLKIGHHGSSTSTTPAFLAAVAPRYAVISAGRHNPFGHPRVPVLDELSAAHVRVYRTDTLGLSTFLLDGRNITAQRNSGQ